MERQNRYLPNDRRFPAVPRRDRATQIANQTDFEAELVELAGGGVLPHIPVLGDAYQLLTFSMDQPNWLIALLRTRGGFRQAVDGDQVPVAGVFTNVSGQTAILHPYVADSGLNFDPAVTQLGDGAGLDIQTATGNVRVRGYVSEVLADDPELPGLLEEPGGAEVTTALRMRVLLSSRDVASIGEYRRIIQTGDATFDRITPVILREQDYTAAIRDNDDVIVGGTLNGVTSKYIVQGLWTSYTPQ